MIELIEKNGTNWCRFLLIKTLFVVVVFAVIVIV